MNSRVRDFLIQKAKSNKTATYQEVSDECSLGLFMTEGDHPRAEIGRILGEIGEYEYRNGRPILSSIVITSISNSHGDGFYRLCEHLGLGYAKKLKNDDFGIIQMRECFDYWKNADQSQLVYSNNVENTSDNTVPFFTKEDLDFFAKYAGVKYRSDNLSDVEVGEKLRATVYKKTKHWANSTKLDGYKVKHDGLWQISGNFKRYTWARVYRPKDKGRHIFFTLGIGLDKNNAPCLIYKLDCQWSKNSKKGYLEEDKVERFYSFIRDTGSKWVQINADELPNYDWQKLINKTNKFISECSDLYDGAIEYVWNDVIKPGAITNKLIQRDKPKALNNTNGTGARSFKGVDVDFETLNKERKEIGDAGEKLVIENEKRLLKEVGLLELSEKVCKAKDGEGYDILSFSINDKSNKYIEVKTTTSRDTTPFNISANELEFLKKNFDSYFLYRIYNYSEVSNGGEYFVINGSNINSFVELEPINYIARLK